jgi:hypothetical protein
MRKTSRPSAAGCAARLFGGRLERLTAWFSPGQRSQSRQPESS